MNRSSTSRPMTAHRLSSIPLTPCLFIQCCSAHRKSVTAADPLTFDPVLSVIPQVVWLFVTAPQVCPVEVSIPMCSVIVSVLLFWQLSQHLDAAPFPTLFGEWSLKVISFLCSFDHLFRLNNPVKHWCLIIDFLKPWFPKKLSCS